MNATRKKALRALYDQLDSLASGLDNLVAAERQQFDRLSKKRQADDEGQQIEDSALALERAADALQDALESIFLATGPD